MKLLSILGAAVTFGSCAGYQNVRENFGDHKVVHLNPEHMTPEVRSILAEFDADHIGLHDEGVAMKLSQEGVRQLEQAGVSVRDGTEEWVNHFQANFDNPKLFCTGSDKECADKSAQDFFSTYQPLGAMHLRVEQATANVDFANTYTLGLSYYKQNLQMTEIGDMDKPLAFFICNIHAREWLTPMYCTHMIETLVANGGHPLLDHFSFAIITSANPDGYEYSRLKVNLWRKTRMPNVNNDCVGTDPNRNYDDHHCEEGSSTDPCSETYCGVEPFNQPETAAIRDYANAHADNLVVWTDFHSYGGYWLSALGYTTELPAEYPRMHQCMEEVKQAIFETNGLQFIIGSSGAELYVNSGSSKDWFYESLGVIHGYVAEMRGPSFQPDPSNIIPNNAEIFAGMQAQMQCVGRLELGIDFPEVTPISYPTASPVEGEEPIVVPANFTCDAAWYHVGDGCDCNCGTDVDPDCEDFGPLWFCQEGESCNNGACEVIDFPREWTCPGRWYGTGNGCDCGCGAVDPDCEADPAAEVTDRCGDAAECLDTGGICVPDAWSCERETFAAGDGCQCGCGVQDPDCDTVGQEMVGCEADEVCVAAECVEAVTPPAEWTCSETWYGSGNGCDCNCGAHDPDCDATELISSDCDTGYLCSEALCVFPGGEDWTCAEATYNTGDGCDCDCGAPDPDCEKEFQPVFGCQPGATCEVGECFLEVVQTEAPVAGNTTSAPVDGSQESGSQAVLIAMLVIVVIILIAIAFLLKKTV